jgi:hypothetical protein
MIDRVAHTDHPLRLWDRTCPACNPFNAAAQTSEGRDSSTPVASTTSAPAATDTPETDAARNYKADVVARNARLIDLAESLERRLKRAQAALAEANRRVVGWSLFVERAEKTEAERDALREDAARYRWLRCCTVAKFREIQHDNIVKGIHFDAQVDAEIAAARGKP